jgi:hypothetical protein
MSAKRATHRIDPNVERTRQRDRALNRLSQLTTATAVAGTVAAFGFAGLAAVTYSGTPVALADDPAGTLDGTSNSVAGSDDQSFQNQPTTADDSGTTTQGGSSASGSQSTTPQATTRPSTRQYTYVQPPTRSTRRGHSSTGAS